MKKITLRNDFHNTEINLVPHDGKLSPSQVARARRTLCGIENCCCSGDLGTRGPQDGFELEPIYDTRLGEIIGAIVHPIHFGEVVDIIFG